MAVPQFHSLAVVMRVCVDHLADGQLSGRVYCPCISDEAFGFTDIGNMLLQMEEIFDSRGIPGAYNKTRSFGNPRQASLVSDVMQRDEISENLVRMQAQSGSLNTFELLVTTRQNATWQGWINWSGEERERFVSALQLIRRIDARLVRTAATPPEQVDIGGTL